MRTTTRHLLAVGALSSVAVVQPAAQATQVEPFTIAPSEGPPHTVVTVSGSNCTGPSPSVVGELEQSSGDAIPGGNAVFIATPDATGAWSDSLTVPPVATPGPHRVVARCLPDQFNPVPIEYGPQPFEVLPDGRAGMTVSPTQAPTGVPVVVDVSGTECLGQDASIEVRVEVAGSEDADEVIARGSFTPDADGQLVGSGDDPGDFDPGDVSGCGHLQRRRAAVLHLHAAGGGSNHRGGRPGAGEAQVHIVPHTHWDREWYSPFQTFRLRLVDLLDELLPALEADPGYAHFLLDGQMAVVDDYLAIRPEAEAALARLAASGRVAMGPWYALPDEFLVSGETLIRNLQRGLQAATRFGGAMEVGYLPDMFGHVAQMPQLLRQFGFEHTVVWRGVPQAMDRTGFWWRSPDGSEVRAEYLPQGYGNGARVPEDAKALLRRIDEFTEEQGERLVGAVLWMNGTDHLPPQPWLGRVVAEANALQDDVELRICSLAEHLAAAPTDDLPVWEGELRSGARANLLMGVTSNRTDVRVAAARAERALEQLAEPLNAMLRPADAGPARCWTKPGSR